MSPQPEAQNAHDDVAEGPPPTGAPLVAGGPEPVHISIVVPVYDEEQSLPQLHAEIAEHVGGMGRPWRVIYVDDRSRDGSFDVLLGLRADDPHVRVVRFRRNFGQTAAMSAGFEQSEGHIVITLDADLQNDPADIPRLVEELERGYDIVVGWRKERHDGFLLRRLPSQIANRLIARVTGANVHDTGCTLKAFRRELVENLPICAEQHRFLPVLSLASGARMSEVVVHHRPRIYGTSKYGIGRAVRVLLDLLTVKMISSFTRSPLQYFALLAMPFAALTCFFLAVGVANYGEISFDNKWGQSVLLTFMLCSMAFVYFILLGLLAELVIKVSGLHRRKSFDPLRSFDPLGGGDGGMSVVEPVEAEGQAGPPREPQGTAEIAARVDVTVIVPVQHADAEVVEVVAALGGELERIGKTWECLLVYDGIKGAVWDAGLSLQASTDQQVRTIALHKPFGESVCLSSAFEHTSGDVILTSPEYVQIDPHEVESLMERIESGADVAISWRHPRVDAALNRIQSASFNRVMRALVGASFHDLNCTLRAMRREVLEELNVYGNMYRYLPVIAHTQGFRVDEVKVRHLKERGGSGIFGPGVYVRRLLDVLGVVFLTKFTHKPLRFFGALGGLSISLGFLISGVLFVQHMLDPSVELFSRPIFLLGVLFAVLGIQIIGFGLVGEIIIFTQARHVREYRIERIYE